MDGELMTGYEDAIANPTREWFAGLKKVLHFEMRNGHAYVLAKDAASYNYGVRLGHRHHRW
ncbi:MAG: hypothetical protein GWN00_27890 [Aliifodinibius sp.]|nr:hypothetical protein [Fodinibius sp.]NIV14626.1 hypothetical protein [Fodinibius sp.]NIY28486.1 hypothetical protein [Fodinibius sp.]